MQRLGSLTSVRSLRLVTPVSVLDSPHKAFFLRFASPVIPRGNSIKISTTYAPQKGTRGGVRPLLSFKGDTHAYNFSEVLAKELRRSPEVIVNGSGVRIAHTVLHGLIYARHDLYRTTGFLPRFGRLALRLDKYTVPTWGSAVLEGAVARLIDVPVSEGFTVLSRRSDPEEVRKWLRHELHAHNNATFRLVGEVNASNVLRLIVTGAFEHYPLWLSHLAMELLSQQAGLVIVNSS